MSNEVDERIVQMEFDNAKFEKNVEQSMSTLDKLKEKLQFKNASTGLTKLERQMNDISFDGMASSINGVAREWTIFDSVVDQTMRNITNKITSVVNKLSTELGNSFVYMSEGWQKYNGSIEAVQKLMASMSTEREKQAIQALVDAGKELDEAQEEFLKGMSDGNTLSEDKKLAYVEYYTSKLASFSDETSYYFDSMSQALGTFVSQANDLDKSVKAIEGIAVIGGKAGANAQKVAHAMSQIGQFLGRNVNQLDWQSIETAGMDTEWLKLGLMEKASITEEEFNQAVKNGETIVDGLVKIGDKYYMASKLAQTSNAKTYAGLIAYVDGIKDGTNATEANIKAMEEAEVTVDKFRSSLSNGWLAGKYFVDLANDYGEFAYRIDELSKNCTAGYAPIKDLQALIDLYADDQISAATKQEEINKLVKKYGYDVETLTREIEALSSAELAESRAAYTMSQQSKTLGDVLGSIREAASTVWSNIFKALTGDYLQAKDMWTNINESLYDLIIAPLQAKQELIQTWADAGGREHLWDIVQTLIDLGVTVKNTFRNAWASVFGEGSAVLDLLGAILKKIDEWAKELQDLFEENEEGELYFDGLYSTLVSIFSFLKKISDKIKEIFSSFVAFAKKLFTGFDFEEFLDKVGDAFSWVADKIVQFFNWLDTSGALDTIKSAGSWLLNCLTSVASIVPTVTGAFKSAGNSVASFFKNLFNKNGNTGVSRALTGTIAEASALTRSRVKNITGEHASVKKKGQGLGIGPVGDTSIFNRFSNTLIKENGLTRGMDHAADDIEEQTENIENVNEALEVQAEALNQTADAFLWFKKLENKINGTLENWKDTSRSFWANFADTEFFAFMYTANEVIFTFLKSAVTFIFSTLSELLDALTGLSKTNPILVAIIGEVAITLFAIRRLMKFIGWGAAALDDAAMGLYRLGQAAVKAAKASNKRAIGKLILDIGLSIAAIAGSIWILAQVGDPDTVAQYAKTLMGFVIAFGVIAGVLIAIESVCALLGDILAKGNSNGSKSIQVNLRKTQSSLMGLGIALASLAVSLWIFSKIPTEHYWDVLGFLGGIVLVLISIAAVIASAEKLLPDQMAQLNEGFKRIGSMIFTIATALLPIVAAFGLLKLLKIDPAEAKEYGNALIGLFVVCGAIGTTMIIFAKLFKVGSAGDTLSSQLNAFGVSLLEVTASLAVIAGALWLVKQTDMTTKEMWTFGGSLIGMLIIISAIMLGFGAVSSVLGKNNQNYDFKALKDAGVAILAAAASMGVIAGAIWLFAKAEKSLPAGTNMWKYVGIMAAMLGAITVSMLLLEAWSTDSYKITTNTQKYAQGKTKQSSVNKGGGMQKSAKDLKEVGDAFIKVAASMSLIAVALRLIGNMKTGDAWRSFGIMALMINMVGGVLFLMSTFSRTSITGNSKTVTTKMSNNMREIGVAFIEIAASMLIMAAGFYLMGKAIESVKNPWGALGAIAGFLVVIGGVLLVLEAGTFSNANKGTRITKTSSGLKEIGVAFIEIASSLAIVAAALWILAYVQRTFGQKELWSTAGMLGAFLGAVGLILVALSQFQFKSANVSIDKASDSFIKIGIAFNLIAASLFLFVGALWWMANLPMDVIKSGTTAMVAIVLAIGATMFIMSNSFKNDSFGHIAALVLAFMAITAMVALAVMSFKTIETVPMGTIIAAGAVIAGMALAIAGALGLLSLIAGTDTKKLYSLVGAFGLMAAALVGLTASMLIVASIPVDKLAAAGIALAGAAVIMSLLIVVAGIFADKSAGIFAISGACVVFSAALILAGLAAEIFVDAIIKLLNAFSNLSTMTDEELTRSSNSMGSFVSVMGEAVDTFIKSLIKGLISLLEAIVENSDLVIDAIFVVVDGIVNALVRLSDKIGEIVNKLVASLIRTIVNGIVDLMNILTERMPEITEFIKSVVASLVEVIVSALDLILEKLTEEVDLVNHKSRIQVWTESLVQILFDSIIGAINATADAIEPLIDSIIKLIIAVIDGTGEAIYKNSGDFADSINNFVSNIIAAVITVLTGVSVIKQIKDGVTKAITGGFKESTGNNGDMAKNIKDSFKNIGTNILNGIKEGIENAWNALKNAAANVGNGIVNLFQKIFDINSPSRVMAEMGMYLDQGLANGIADNVNSVVRSSNGLADSTITPLQQAFADLSSYLDENVDSQPTIRPVMDLTDIQNGANSIYGLMSGMDDLSMRSSINATAAASRSMRYSNVPGYTGQTATSSNENTNITNNFNITGDNPKEIANEVSRILQEQVGRRNKVWA